MVGAIACADTYASAMVGAQSAATSAVASAARKEPSSAQQLSQRAAPFDYLQTAMLQQPASTRTVPVTWSTLEPPYCSDPRHSRMLAIAKEE